MRWVEGIGGQRKPVIELDQSVGPVPERTASRVWAAEYRDRDTIKRRAFLEDDFISDAHTYGWPAAYAACLIGAAVVLYAVL